jgi:multidrug resistance protein MdtO
MSIECRGEGLFDFVRLMAPRRGRFELSFRLGIVCALTVLVVEIFQTPDPALTVYIVFFLNHGDRAASLVTSVVLLAVFTAIVGFVLLVAMVVIDDPMWRVVSITVISIGVLFTASTSKLRALGGTVAVIVGYALDLLGATPLALGEEATRSLLYAWLFVAIPVCLSIIVNLLLAPPPRRLAEQGIAHGLELSVALIEAANESNRAPFKEYLREAAAENEKLLSLANREATSRPEDIAALRHAADSTTFLMSALDVIDRKPDLRLAKPMADYLVRILRKMSSILKNGGYPIRIIWDPPKMERALTTLEAEVLDDIRDAIVHFAEASPAERRVGEAKEEGDGFFSKDAFSNPAYIQYALKTTAAAMFCYFLYSLLDWSGIHTCFLTCYIVSLGTAAETVEKLTLRILGCLVGALAGYGTMIFLIPYLDSIAGLMAVVFAGALAAGYVAAGCPRISYAGFQIAIAFFLCVIQGPSPAFDLSTARDRVIGILLGNVVVYLLFTNLWPISVGVRIDPAIAAVLRRLAALAAVNKGARPALLLQAHSKLAEIQSDIDIAAYEPSTLRPSGQWLAVRRQAVRDIGTLSSPLLLNLEKDTLDATQIARRLETQASRFAFTEILRPLESPSKRKTSAFFPLVDEGLRRLEEASI